MQISEIPAKVTPEEFEETRARYRTATERYRRLLREQPQDLPPSTNGVLALARQAESEALAEYALASQIMRELPASDKEPEEGAAAASEDA